MEAQVAWLRIWVCVFLGYPLGFESKAGARFRVALKPKTNTCERACLSVWLFGCLCLCLPVLSVLSACLPACLPACLSFWVCVCVLC